MSRHKIFSFLSKSFLFFSLYNMYLDCLMQMKPSCCCCCCSNFFFLLHSMKIIFNEAIGTNVKTKSAKEKNHHCCLGIIYFPGSAMRTSIRLYSTLYIPTIIMNRLKKQVYFDFACMLKCACLTVVKRNENSIFHCAVLN